ncbi:transposase [Candidatus Gottesmanbacteria bacterium]|nr:transposase [Candidatus Gottesmanbacteria bacterium]
MLDYERHYRNQLPLVEIYSYSYMPNHYHFLLKQKQDKGVQLFIGNLQNSFAKYFNIKNSRDGGLFQNSFKAKRVETDEEFIHISRYIHLNPVTSYLIEFNKLTTYPWTSFPIYAGNSPSNFINTLFITHHFKTKEKYIQFCADQVNYQRNLNKIKHLLVD